MAGETKSNGQKDILDRFYTPEDTVKKCLELLDLKQYDCIIEPSAGTGNFLKYLPQEPFVYGFDINPQGKNINQADWLTLDKSIFNQYKNILVCGNPPFGQQNTLAIQFFNVSASFCNIIAFILPLSFKKDSVQNRLDLNFHLTDEIIFNSDFLLLDKTKINVPCVFQVWQKQSQKRTIKKQKTISELFDFVKKDEADFRIQRVGGNAGKASFDLDKAISSNYFIKNKSDISNEDFVNFVNSLVYPSIAYTTGPKSLSKGELISTIEENF